MFWRICFASKTRRSSDRCIKCETRTKSVTNLLGELGLRRERDAILRLGRRFGAKHSQLLFERVSRRAPLGELEQFGRRGRGRGATATATTRSVRSRSGRGRHRVAVRADAEESDTVALERDHQQAALAVVTDGGARNQRLGESGQRFETRVRVKVLGG